MDGCYVVSQMDSVIFSTIDTFFIEKTQKYDTTYCNNIRM